MEGMETSDLNRIPAQYERKEKFKKFFGSI